MRVLRCSLPLLMREMCNYAADGTCVLGLRLPRGRIVTRDARRRRTRRGVYCYIFNGHTRLVDCGCDWHFGVGSVLSE